MKAILLILLFYSNAILAGEIIPPFSAMELTTNQLQQFDFSKASTPTVVAFISKDCPCSKGNIPYLKELANQYKQFHFLIVHAKKDTSNLEVNNYLKANQVNFQAINDDKLSITNAFKALKTPHIYIINQKNEIIYNGAVTNSTFPEDASEYYLKNALKDIASNQPIKKNETKTMGCFIVR